MVTDTERQLVNILIWLKLWRTFSQMRIVQIHPKFGTRWIYNWLRGRQIIDNLKHAPCCPANNYHGMRLVFQRCNCGAQAMKISPNDR